MKISHGLRILVILFLLGFSSAYSATFTFRILGEPETLDWNRAHTPIEVYVLTNLMEGLVSLDAKLKPVPALAESWKISKDGKVFTFKLRPGVKWSDGVSLRAQDFIASWKRLLSPSTAATCAYFLFDVVGAEDFYRGRIKDFSQVGVSASDDHTLIVKLNHSLPHWIYIPTYWSTFPVREDLIVRYGGAWTLPGNMVSVGPYLLERYDVESKVVMKPNPFYYGKRGNLDEVVGLIVKDDATALKLYETGKIDFLTDLPSLDLPRLEKTPDLKIFPYLKTAYLGLVIDKAPLTNRKLRRAIAMAIDKSKFNELLHGGQTPGGSFVPPPLHGYSKDLGLKFDLKAAKEELASSGLDMTHPIQIDFTVSTLEKSLVIGQYIQDQLKRNLGLNVTLQTFDNKAFRVQVDQHTFPLFLLSWSADYPDPDNFISIFLSDSGNNRMGWNNSEFDTGVVSARGMSQSKQRDDLYFRLQKTLQEENAVVIPLYYEPNLGLVNPRVRGLDLNPINVLNLKNVSIVLPNGSP